MKIDLTLSAGATKTSVKITFTVNIRQPKYQKTLLLLLSKSFSHSTSCLVLRNLLCCDKSISNTTFLIIYFRRGTSESLVSSMYPSTTLDTDSYRTV